MEENKGLKEILRKEFLQKRNNLDKQLIEDASTKIIHKLLKHHLYMQSENILMYVPFKGEVNILPLIEHSWSIGKNILLPKTNPHKKEMELYLITSWDETEIGNYQIIEPIVSNKAPFPIERVELVLVPGVIYDKNGYRLGYGGGYYDRFLSRFSRLPYLIGVAYDFQLLDSLPNSDHDIQMDEIITETKHIILS